MLVAFVGALRSLALICSGHRAVALENLALRHQFGGVQAHGPAASTPRSRSLFWLLLAHAWRDWRTALIIVRPDTGFAARFGRRAPNGGIGTGPAKTSRRRTLDPATAEPLSMPA
jgi:hypothetical protein